MWTKMIYGRPPQCERMTGLSMGQLSELVDRVREVVGPWESPAVGRPHVLPLFAAVVAVLFGLRHNLAEVFGCSQATITRYHHDLHPILRWVTPPGGRGTTRPCPAQRCAGRRVRGPVGEREGYHGLFLGKKHLSGQNVQVVADLDGRVADVGDPVPGARHDGAAFFISGIAERWAGHYAPGGPGMIGDGGYQGIGMITPDRKRPGGELDDRQKSYNYSVNRLRAAVERAIAHLKTWRVLKAGYHRAMTNFPDLLRTVTGLEIFRVWGPGFE
jgi:hypothetical protein